MSMIERVARAICEAHTITEESKVPLEEWVDAVWSSYEPLAKAAIEAMRLPTEAMFEGLDWPGHASAYYKAMISNALKQEVT